MEKEANSTNNNNRRQVFSQSFEWKEKFIFISAVCVCLVTKAIFGGKHFQFCISAPLDLHLRFMFYFRY